VTIRSVPDIKHPGITGKVEEGAHLEGEHLHQKLGYSDPLVSQADPFALCE